MSANHKTNPMDDRSRDGQPFDSVEEQNKAMRDERYKKDEAYQQRVIARIAATSDDTTGVSINKSLPLSDEGLSDIEQVNPNMAWGMQTIPDFMKMIKSNEYKTNPAYRLAVEQAMQAATPDWEPRTSEAFYRVEVDPKGEGEGGDPSNSPAEAF